MIECTVLWSGGYQGVWATWLSCHRTRWNTIAERSRRGEQLGRQTRVCLDL